MSAKRTARWRGSTEITEHPESPEWDFNNDDEVCTKTFEGPYALLLSKRPAIGSALEGVPAGFTVDRVKIKRHKSTKGTMTIILTHSPSSSPDAGEEPPKYEVEWVEVQKPVEQHPIFHSGEFSLSIQDWTDVAAWEDEPDAALRREFMYKGADGDDVILGTPARKLAEKKAHGTTSYMVFPPVLRRTQARRTNVSSSAAGGRQDPPEEFGTLPKQPNGSAYVWFKTADRSVRAGKNGKWQRVEEWTGFDHIDEDLYPA